MIVLHVARARTDSINIRGSLGKTWAALWITNATFLYFSRCNAHTPFTLFPFLSLSLSFSYPRRPRRVCLLSTVFPYLPVIVLRFSLSSARAMLLVLSSVSLTPCLFLPSFCLSLSTRRLHPPRFPALSRNRRRRVTLQLLPRSELLPSRPKWKLLRCPIPGSRARGTELPDNPLICPVITATGRPRFDAGVLEITSRPSQIATPQISCGLCMIDY